MAVRIRLSRFGRLHRPYFRIVAIDGRCHREGKANEILGSYDPLLKDKNLQVDLAAVESWVNRGAQISTGLRNLLKFSGYQVPAPKKTAAAKPEAKPAKPAAKKAKPAAKGTYRAPTRRSLRKHAAKLKGVRKGALAAETAAKAAAAAAAAPAAPAAEAPKA
jgi:small subunit ribosomal protein S16